MFRIGLCRFTIVVGIAAVALIISVPRSLCAQQSSPDQAPTAPPAQPAQKPLPPPSGHLSRSPLHFALPRREYLCDGSARVVILIETNAARLTLNDHIYNMKQVETTSGTKYADGSVVWSSNGENGSLEDDTDPQKPQMRATNCHLQSAYPPVAQASERVTGTVTYRQRIALPPDAVVLVHLQDVYLPDAPSPFIAEYKTTFGGRQVPIPFTLKFDPAKIDPKHPYVVEASILVHDRVKFTNDTAYFVLTQGHPAKINMILVAVDAPTGAKP